MNLKHVSFLIQCGLYSFLLIGAVVVLSITNIVISIASQTGSIMTAANNLTSTLTRLERSRDKLSRYTSHQEFLSQCLEQKVCPKGMTLKFGKSALPKSEFLHSSVDTILDNASRDILLACKDSYTSLILEERETQEKILFDLFQDSNLFEYECIRQDHIFKSQKLLRTLRARKKKKLQNLIGARPPTPSQLEPANKKKKNRRFVRKHNQKTPTCSETDKKMVVNLSSHPLTDDQLSVLSLGPKFCPTPRSLNHQQLSEDVAEGCRRVRLRELFFDPECPDAAPTPAPKFYKKTGYQPPCGRDRSLDAFCHSLQSRVQKHQPTTRPRDNLSPGQRTALKELTRLVDDRTIRISLADKGGAVVVQDTTAYIQEADRQLSDTTKYETLAKDPTAKIAKVSNTLVTALHDSGHINDNTRDWAQIQPNDTRCHQFYTLPKIHKTLDNPPGRPIISGVSGPTEKLSKLVAHWLQPAVCRLPSYLKDSTHMLQTIAHWNQRYGPFPPNTQLVTIDVVNLYNTIPQDEMLDAMNQYLLQTPHTIEDPRPPTDRVLALAEHVLTNNVFTFEGKHYRQTQGTAMGTPMAPAAANLFMGKLESALFESSPTPLTEEFWRRFIDDIFMLWTGTLEDLDTFLDYINTFHYSIKFTHTISSESIPFLDINISLKDGFLHTDLYSKPTDAHAYLHFFSCHPRHTLQNMPYSQFLRLRRLCSDDDTFNRRCDEMTTWFLRRGHNKLNISQARQKATNTPRTQALTYKPKASSNRTPVIITHHPSNPPLRAWISELHKHVLHSSERMQQAVPDLPIVGERNTRNIKSLLMPSILPTAKANAPGCFKCNKTCAICTNHLIQTTTFKSMQTLETFHIRHTLTCETENIIYMLYCDKCNNSQYVGETKNKLKTRFYLHRSNINKNTGTLVTKHFNQRDHSLANMKCIAIEKVHTNNLQKRLQRENFWKTKLKTDTPLGLNTK